MFRWKLRREYIKYLFVVAVMVIALLNIFQKIHIKSNKQSLASQTQPTNRIVKTIEGTAVYEGALQGANVKAFCNSGSVYNSITASDGTFSLNPQNSELPCMIEVSGGYIFGAENFLVLHSIAASAGSVNVTPLSELALAYIFKESPQSTFLKFSKKKSNIPVNLLEGQNYIKQQLTYSGIATLNEDLFNSPIHLGDSSNSILNGLSEKLSLSHKSLSDLKVVSSARADWTKTLKVAPSDWKWVLPPSLLPPAVPQNNPMSYSKVELGRYLFYDKRLSGNNTFSCSSCHIQKLAFSDGKGRGVGSTGEIHPRGPMSLGNVAYNPTLTWANPTLRTFEDQANAPLFGSVPVEMGVNDKNKTAILLRLKSDPHYTARFKAAFPGQDNILNWYNVIKAISSFERTLLTGNSRYDQSNHGGPPLSISEKRGSDLFFTRANCFRCHGNFNFTDTVVFEGSPTPQLLFHNTGLFNIGGTGAFPAPNRGVFEFTKKAEDMGKFRAPSLRNIAITAPYMHDGSFATLQDVLNFYGNHGREITTGPEAGDGRKNPFKDDIVNGIVLNEQDKVDIIAFLQTLTDNEFLNNPNFSDPFLEH